MLRPNASNLGVGLNRSGKRAFWALCHILKRQSRQPNAFAIYRTPTAGLGGVRLIHVGRLIAAAMKNLLSLASGSMARIVRSAFAATKASCGVYAAGRFGRR